MSSNSPPNKSCENQQTGPEAQRPTEMAQHAITPGHHGRLFFDPGDGDMKLCVNGTYFEAHRYLIKRFRSLKPSCNILPGMTLHLSPDKYTAKDFENTLKVLYATALEGPFEFDKLVLESALRIATLCDYPELASYAIERLNQANLSAIERIKIAREFALESWEEPAYIELCERNEPISTYEANILGVHAFVQVAGIRERAREKRKNLKEIDVREEQTNESRVGDEHEEIDPGITGPRFIYFDTHDDYYPKDAWTTEFVSAQVKVTGCPCEFAGQTEYTHCTLPACAAAAFKHIQLRQIEHAKYIAKLQSSLDELKAFHAPAPEPPIAPKPIPEIHEEVRLMLGVLRSASTAG